jgi:hypothetical protein
MDPAPGGKSGAVANSQSFDSHEHKTAHPTASDGLASPRDFRTALDGTYQAWVASLIIARNVTRVAG